jgi:hypothetical protein
LFLGGSGRLSLAPAKEVFLGGKTASHPIAGGFQAVNEAASSATSLLLGSGDVLNGLFLFFPEQMF